MANYTQIKISVHPDIALAFKETCASSNISMTSVISQYIAHYSQVKLREAIGFNIRIRSERKKRVKDLVQRLDQIRAAEERYMENIPQNLQNSQFYENAEHAISAIEEAIQLLETAY